MEYEVRRIAAERGIEVTEQQIQEICRQLARQSEQAILGIDNSQQRYVEDYVRPLEIDPYYGGCQQHKMYMCNFVALQEQTQRVLAQNSNSQTVAEVIEMQTSDYQIPVHRAATYQYYDSQSRNVLYRPYSALLRNKQDDAKANERKEVINQQKALADIQNDDDLDDFRFTYDQKVGTARFAGYQMQEHSYLMYNLMPKNKVTIYQRKFRKSDPVSNYRKYYTRWNVQGPPDERKQRYWKNKVEDSVGYFLACNGYK